MSWNKYMHSGKTKGEGEYIYGCQGQSSEGYFHEATEQIEWKKSEEQCLPQINKKKLEEKYKKINICLPNLEKEILKKLKIKKIWGRINYFTGTHYERLNLDIFCSYCKKYLPQEIQNKICSVKIFKSLYQYVLYDFVSEKEDIHEDNYLISCENCVVDAQTLDIYKHDESMEVPYTVRANYIDDVYESYSADNFNKLLWNMTDGDDDSIQLIWEMLGYTLLHVSPKRAFFWLGTEPASGKSLLGDFIQRILGIENCSQIEADDIGKRFSMSQFIAKRVNLGMESSGKLSRIDVVRLKEITGNKTISIEQKGIDRLDLPNFAVLIFASNEPVSIGDADLTDAFWERCKLIPCVKSCPVEERDVNLLEKLWEERDIIVSQAIKAANDLISRDFCFTEPQIAKRMKEEWRRNSGSIISLFIKEYLEIIPGKEGYAYFMPTEELYKHYINYIGDDITKKAFSSQFNRYSAGKVVKGKKRVEGYSSAVNGFYNVRIRVREDDGNGEANTDSHLGKTDSYC